MAKTSLMVKASRPPKFKVRAYNRCPLCGRPRAFFHDQSGRSDLPFHIRRTTEHEFLAGANIALDGSVYLCHRNLDHGFRYLGASAND